MDENNKKDKRKIQKKDTLSSPYRTQPLKPHFKMCFMNFKFSLYNWIEKGKYMPDERYPYFLLPEDFCKENNIKSGDLAAVISENKKVYAFMAGYSGKGQFGIASNNLAHALGYDTSHDRNEFSVLTGNVVYVIFPESAKRNKEIKKEGEKLFDLLLTMGKES